MEVCKQENETSRSPFFPANKNGARARETSSRFRSPSRDVSTERRRASRPPSTPLKDTTVEALLESRKVAGSKLKDIWPSTMRSLTVAFQSDILYVPASKKEKPVSQASDRVLKPPSNVAERKSQIKHIRDREKKSADQTENSKPVDGLNSRLVNQYQWPSKSKDSFLCHSESNAPSVRRLSKPHHKTLSSDVNGKAISDERLVLIRRVGSSTSSDRLLLSNAAARALSIQAHSSTPSSPSVFRGISPRPRDVGPSPGRVRLSSPSRQPQPNSVLRFFADIKKGNKAANHIEDVHDLRLLYNRHLQWRYTNAQSDDVLHFQQVKTEKTLYNMCCCIGEMRHAAAKIKIGLQQLKLKLMLHSVVNSQLIWLNKWAAIERDHSNSLSSAIKDLQANTICVPITHGAKGNVETVKEAVCSALDVLQAILQAMGSFLFPMVSQVEGTNSVVSQLAKLASRERAMLDECESLLGFTAALQIEEHSLLTHRLQQNQANGERSSARGF